MKLLPRRYRGSRARFAMATVIALDFETSGYAATAACAIGMVRIVDGSITDSFSSILSDT